MIQWGTASETAIDSPKILSFLISFHNTAYSVLLSPRTLEYFWRGNPPCELNNPSAGVEKTVAYCYWGSCDGFSGGLIYWLAIGY